MGGPDGLSQRRVVAATGVAAGLFGDLMMLVLFSVQHLAFGYHAGSLEAAASRAWRSCWNSPPAGSAS